MWSCPSHTRHATVWGGRPAGGAQCSLRLWYRSPLGLCCVWQMPGRATLLLPLGLGVLADTEALGRLTVWSLATALLDQPLLGPGASRNSVLRRSA